MSGGRSQGNRIDQIILEGNTVFVSATVLMKQRKYMNTIKQSQVCCSSKEICCTAVSCEAFLFTGMTPQSSSFDHGENAGTLGMGGPLIINPIYTLYIYIYSGYLLGLISPFKGLPKGG